MYLQPVTRFRTSFFALAAIHKSQNQTISTKPDMFFRSVELNYFMNLYTDFHLAWHRLTSQMLRVVQIEKLTQKKTGYPI